MDNVANNKETTEQRNARLKAIGFQPGQSGNPNGRPHNPLKDFQRKDFAKMSDKQKKEFLKKIGALDRWKMAEGNPDSDVNLQAELVSKIISVDE